MNEVLLSQKHYVAAGEYIIKSILNSNGANKIRYFSCLSPNNIKSRESIKHICKIAKLLPLNIRSDVLTDQWKLLQLYIKIDDVDVNIRIDHFWRKIFEQKTDTGICKYDVIEKVVKNALLLSHGSADVERSFSTSARILTEDRAGMSERTLNARLIVKDALQQYDNQVCRVPITKELLSLGRVAYKNYNLFLEEEKAKKAEVERLIEKNEEIEKIELEKKAKAQDLSKDITLLEEKLRDLKDTSTSSAVVVDKLIDDAAARLKDAINKKNLEEANIAQVLLQGLQEKRKEEVENRHKAANVQTLLEKRKSSLISKFIVKKPKMQ